MHDMLFVLGNWLICFGYYCSWFNSEKDWRQKIYIYIKFIIEQNQSDPRVELTASFWFF